MRLSFTVAATGALMLACADAPTAPLLQPVGGASLVIGKAPPPWALIEGEITTDGGGTTLSLSPAFSVSGVGNSSFSHSAGGNTAVYVGWFLVTPGGHTTILRFAEGGTNVTFSTGAAIMNVNGKVSGKGTMIVGGRTYELSAVTEFEANRDCALVPWDYQGPSCASFSAGDDSFSSEGSVWTGLLTTDAEDTADGVASLRSCAASPDFVVTSQAQLSSALAAAGAGSTIAVDGVIAVTGMISIEGDDIRLTCASAGSGLIVASGSSPFALLRVAGDGVQVDNLFLSSVPSVGTGGALHTIFANNFPDPVLRLRLRLNRIRCRNGTCAFLVSAPGAVVSENLVESLGTSSGIHVQGSVALPTDNTVVERNNIVAPTVSGSPLFGSIRVRDGRDLVVRYNATSGAWRNGIALSELDGARIEDNFIRQALDHGILASTNPLSAVSVRNSIFRANRIDGPQAIGISLNLACWNRVENNEVSVVGTALRARFESTTGANVYVGNTAAVLDQGSYDCDGNGKTDPNTIRRSSSASSSQASATRLPPASVRSYRSASHSDGTKFPELQ